MDIVKYIPVGRKNAISRPYLSTLTGLSDRINRKWIEAARRQGVRIISSSHGRGYYIAEDDNEWLHFLEEHKRRAESILRVYNDGMIHLAKTDGEYKAVSVRAHVRKIKRKEKSAVPTFIGDSAQENNTITNIAEIAGGVKR